ncbi:MAG TPA: adenylosuccinate lyase, partial [Phaeodactylibacter sp.]|nr:adenylosuccinate lyase [Phaeodactylibacter sp.]
MLTAITPIDGRYARATEALRSYFSEYALIRYRVQVEVEYFIMLCEMPLPPLRDIREEQLQLLRQRAALNFTTEDAGRVKEIEAVTRHDVKAVEYFLKEVMEDLGLGKYKEFIHFGLTSQDINNTAFPLMLRDALEEVFYPALSKVILQIEQLAKAWKDVPMLARTHGQPASPTRLGKELSVFAERLKEQWQLLK